eukprot:gene2079-2565_t
MKYLWCTLLITTLLVSQIYAASDYCEVLQKGLMFYKANRAGRLPDTDVPWRGNSVLDDASSPGKKNAAGDGDLSGGYFDAGDHVKFGLPMAYTITMLAWSFTQYEANIAQCGLTDLYLQSIKWGSDYLIAAHISENEMVAQVGNGGADHAYWGPPETMKMDRPVYKISTSAPGTEIAMESAAALAATSMAFSKTDPSYADTCLSHAKQLHSFGDKYRAVYSVSVPDATAFYNSWSGFKDEIVWGSIWLHKATGDESYLTKAKEDYSTFGIGGMAQSNSHDWDLKAPGCALLLYKLTNDETFKKDIESHLNWWLPGGGVSYTPGGLAWIRQWGPARYAATEAFLASVMGGDKYIQFTQKQISYILGDNPQGQSFVVGHGPKHPINPHHRAAHHSTTNNIAVPKDNTYLLVGALVGGPGQGDEYADDRTDYIKNEVACDYNAGFVGALAALVNPSSTPVPSNTPTPTSTPTSTPSDTPTPTPSDTPTPTPSDTPTPTPSDTPTPTPSDTPTPTPSDTPTPTPSQPAGESLPIYADGLKSNFQDWSWGEHNIKDTSNKYSGESSISFTPKNWGAVFLGCHQCIDTEKYKALEFYINGGEAGGQKLSVGLIKNSAKAVDKPLSDILGGPIPSSGWTKVSVNFKDLGVSGKLDGIWIQDNNGAQQGVIHIDDVNLVGTSSNTPIPSSTPNDIRHTIYENSLNSNWQDWSWAQKNLGDPTVSKSGSGKSISFKPDSFTGLYFFCKDCLDSSSQSAIQMYLNGGAQGGQKILISAVSFKDNHTEKIGKTLVVDSVPANTWTKVTLDLKDVNGKADGIMIQDASGQIQQTVYIDEITIVPKN